MRSACPERVVRFDAFTLDQSRCLLLRAGAEIPLRPQAFDMLRYLAANPGRLLTKAELLDAVWPDVHVGEDSLFKCINHIRAALGDHDQRIITTVRKRGYRFTAAVLDVTPPVPLAAPMPRSLLAASRFSLSRGGTRGALAGVLLVAACLGGWVLWKRLPAQAPPHLQAGHYVLQARAILDERHSAHANREAVTLFEKALALDPNSITALLGYARGMLVDVTDGWASSEERLLRFAQAETAIERAITLDPTHANAHFYRGFLWRARGDPDRALAAFEHSRALNPRNAWTYAELGRNKTDVGRAEEAIGDIETAVRLNPHEPRLFNWYYWAGMAAVHAEKSDIALQWFLKWREPNPLYERFIGPWLAVAYADVSEETVARAAIAAHVARVPSFSLASFQRDFPSRNPSVAKQRERITQVLRRLGVPDAMPQVSAP